MEQYILKSALLEKIWKRRHKHFNSGGSPSSEYCHEDDEILSIINTLEVKECETKSGIVQKDLQIVLDDGMYIDLDPSMQLKPSFLVKEGERVKVIISKED